MAGVRAKLLTYWSGRLTEEQGEEARMIDVVMDYSWRHQYELMLNLIYRQLCTEIFIDMCTYISWYTPTHFLSLSVEKA